MTFCEGSLAEEVAHDDSRTTWVLDPSRFCRTFSVTVTLRRRRVEKPLEHSVSVGELGHDAVSRREPSSPPGPLPLQIIDIVSASSCNTELS